MLRAAGPPAAASCPVAGAPSGAGPSQLAPATACCALSLRRRSARRPLGSTLSDRSSRTASATLHQPFLPPPRLLPGCARAAGSTRHCRSPTLSSPGSSASRTTVPWPSPTALRAGPLPRRRRPHAPPVPRCPMRSAPPTSLPPPVPRAPRSPIRVPPRAPLCARAPPSSPPPIPRRPSSLPPPLPPPLRVSPRHVLRAPLSRRAPVRPRPAPAASRSAHARRAPVLPSPAPPRFAAPPLSGIPWPATRTPRLDSCAPRPAASLVRRSRTWPRICQALLASVCSLLHSPTSVAVSILSCRRSTPPDTRSARLHRVVRRGRSPPSLRVGARPVVRASVVSTPVPPQ